MHLGFKNGIYLQLFCYMIEFAAETGVFRCVQKCVNSEYTVTTYEALFR